jgi:hypothetical protein
VIHPNNVQYAPRVMPRAPQDAPSISTSGASESAFFIAAVISSRPIALRCSWIERSMSKRSSDSRGRSRSSAFNSCHSRSATVSSRFAMLDVFDQPGGGCNTAEQVRAYYNVTIQ